MTRTPYCFHCSLLVRRPVTLDEGLGRKGPPGNTPALPPGSHKKDHMVVITHEPAVKP